ncbi:MAG TPA: 3-isopropylmalate dehydratase small subunit [Candidatus Bathyarchaeia archaeon]
MKVRGRAWVFGDDVDTDLIISGKYLTLRDPEAMAELVFAAVRPDFASKVKAGDVVVAGRNFGCGSSREEAPALLKRLGVSLVIAESFARLFFRNSINIGLPLLECQSMAGKVAEGDEVEADLEQGIVWDVTKGEKYEAARLPAFLLSILKAGGAVEAYKTRLVKRG